MSSAASAAIAWPAAFEKGFEAMRSGQSGKVILKWSE
jgi:hypothetical protein